jgi:hypothetical protein
MAKPRADTAVRMRPDAAQCMPILFPHKREPPRKKYAQVLLNRPKYALPAWEEAGSRRATDTAAEASSRPHAGGSWVGQHRGWRRCGQLGLESGGGGGSRHQVPLSADKQGGFSARSRKLGAGKHSC